MKLETMTWLSYLMAPRSLLVLQSLIERHIAVEFGIMAGTHRLQPEAIVHLCDAHAKDVDRRMVLQEIWIMVSEATKKNLTRGRILKCHIMFAAPDNCSNQITGLLSAPL
ncbi:hypothetical protein MMC12_000042 [Toensbergia leucococca]|nr:hypothetical protein [Toensbergia leucococca]